jgi:acetylxylan esterase
MGEKVWSPWPLSYKNVAEDVKEWTNLLGLSETPAGSNIPKSGTTRQYRKNSCGYTVYKTFSLSGVGHSVSVDTAAVTTYLSIAPAREQYDA